MLNEIQVIPGQHNCVIVSTGYPNTQIKMEKRAIPIAPAPVKMTNFQQNITAELLRCRKKMNYKPTAYTGGHQSASIIRRNARERNRVKQVNDGFAALRKHLPPAVVAALSSNAGRGASKKLSKVDTLRMVVEYIRYLQQLLDESDEQMENCGDRTENQENNMFYSSMPMDVSQRLDHGYLLDQTTPPASEASSSPAPSYSSDVSTGYTMNSCFPIEKYENPHQTINPMDEELLDVISWWQQK